jgi:hypothetical protein
MKVYNLIPDIKLLSFTCIFLRNNLYAIKNILDIQKVIISKNYIFLRNNFY